MLGILNKNVFIDCDHTPRLKGFYHSHDGSWNDAWTWNGIENMSIFECANSCLQDCVAFFWGCFRYSPIPAHFCFHYSNRSDIVDANKEFDWKYKAYIKYPGNNT